MKKGFLTYFLPFVIILAGVLIAFGFIKLSPKAERGKASKPVLAVETIELKPGSVTARIQTTGVVTPAKEIILIPEVGGRLDFVSDALVPGGRVEEGQILARIDSREYWLAVEQQRGQVRGAELQLEMEIARQEVAQKEWDMLGEGQIGSPLTLRQSQRAAAEVNVSAGRSGLKLAQLKLARTVLKAPFNAAVISEHVDVGQVVGPQTQVARLVGTDELWVRVSLPVENLSLIEIPGVNSEQGSAARVSHRLGEGSTVERQGKVMNLVGELDPQTRRAQIIVSIPNPMNDGDSLPMLPGAYVDVELIGRPIENVYSIPRTAVYDGDTLLVVGDDNRLARHKVQISWGGASELYVTNGLSAGLQLITTFIANPIEGMTVTTLVKAAAPADGRQAE